MNAGLLDEAPGQLARGSMMDAIVNPRLQRLYRYWCEQRGERRFPARSDIDPLDLTFLMGNLILIDVVDVGEGEPPGFFIRLHGTNLVNRAGYELTGKVLNDLPITEFRQLAMQTFSHVAKTGEPFHGNRDRIIDERPRRYETLILPLSKDGERVDMLLAGLIYADEPEPG